MIKHPVFSFFFFLCFPFEASIRVLSFYQKQNSCNLHINTMARLLATTTLDDIIDELRLKYDSSVGLLDGNAIREIPSLNTLQNLTKLLTKLSRNLDEIEQGDKELLVQVDKYLEPLEDKQDEDKEIIDGDEEQSESGTKRDLEGADLEEESIPLAKRRKQSSKADPEDPEDLEDVELAQAPNENNEDDDVANEAEEGGDTNMTESVTAETDDTLKVNSKDDPVPPVQSGSFTQDNDTRLKNPKSEFVASQTLSASAIAELGLFSEDNNGLETQGKDYLKRKYGVASYPENDLKDLLPGEIPDVDFSKTKAPSNQVQFTTYQSYIESFFRPFSNEDINFANEKFVIPPELEHLSYDPLVSPYLIPKLGVFYADVWAEEDAALRSKLSSPGVQKPPLESYKPKGDGEGLVDEKMLTEDVSCGPLSNRLLSAILSVHEANRTDDMDKENGVGESDIKKEDSIMDDNLFSDDVATQLDSGDAYKVTSDVNDFYSMEERLKRELKYIGIFMNLPSMDDDKPKRPGNIIDSDDWIIEKEDDEICSEIRALQEELKGSVIRNRQRKKYLIPILEDQLAYQEYCTILDDLDKQVDQAYIKRLKAKSKKKKTQEVTNTAQQQAANSGLRALLDKRRRWIDSIGKLFPPAETMKRIPRDSIFKNEVQSDDEEGDAVVDVVNEETA